MDYCNTLYLGLKKSLLLKLQRDQNVVMRMILQKRKFEPVSQYFFEYHWLDVEKRIIFKNLTIIYKCINLDAPKPLYELIEIRDDNQYIRLKDSSFHQENNSWY